MSYLKEQIGASFKLAKKNRVPLNQVLLMPKHFFILLSLFICTGVLGQVSNVDPIPNIKAPSTTKISSSANPSYAGQPVVLTATVTSDGTNQPTGTVHFYNISTNTDLTPGGVSILNGKANYTTNNLSLNTSFKATYGGDSLTLGSTSDEFVQFVNQQQFFYVEPDFFLTTTSLSSSANPSIAGSQPVTFTAFVKTTGSANLTGTVSFWDYTNNVNLTPLGVPLTDSVATFTTSSLPIGDDLNIVAKYSGDGNGNQPSTSNSVIQRIKLNITGIEMSLAANINGTITSFAGTSTWGDEITFIATVSTGIGTPSGTVTFTDNGYLLGTTALDASGKAYLTTKFLTPGTHSIAANYFSKTSNIITQTVNPLFPPVYLNIEAGFGFARDAIISNAQQVIRENPDGSSHQSIGSVYGVPITFAATVQSAIGHAPPTGNFTFYDGTTELGTVGLDATGSGIFTTSLLTVGDHIISVAYSGDDAYRDQQSINDYFKIKSPSQSIMVVPAHTTTSLSSSLNPSIAGQQVTFTATVPLPYFSENALLPTGTVTFNIDGVDQENKPFLTGSKGKAFFNISSLAAGNHTIKATYSGDENYYAGNSNTITQVVEPVGSSLFYFLGNEQTTVINTAFPNHIMFDIVNINPKLNNGASVTFIAPASGASGTFSNGTNTITVNTFKLGYFGVADSGPFTANGIPGTYTVKAIIPGMDTAIFTMTNIAPIVPITVGTSVAGLGFTVDGASYATNQVFNWTAGSNHTLVTTSPQSPAVGSQYTFSSWSDGTTTLTNNITVPSTATTYIAQFQCTQQWVLDNDADTYYTGDPVIACQSPGAGYVPKGDLKPGDCDDNNAAINPGTIWVLDADGDGYSNSFYIPSAGSCTPPQDGRHYIYNPKGTDCNDNNANINPETLWFLDTDGDGYSDNLYIPAPGGSCLPPLDGKHYIYNPKGIDCNDNDPAINPATIWYKDADNDGYSDGMTMIQCTQPDDYKLASNLVSTSGDCNDSNAAISPATLWFLDADGDGYSNSYYIPATGSCTPPQDGRHYINNPKGIDCDDNDPTNNPETVWVIDNDGDGYYTGTPYTGCYLIIPQGAVKITTQQPGDCDDNNAAINPATIWYKDADNDGYSDGNTQKGCAQPTGYKLAGSLTATSGDCDDNNSILTPATIWYKDADNDGYSDGTTLKQCTQPTGYKLATALTSTTIIDCNDNDITVFTKQTYYRDADGDGYGNPAITTFFCSSTPPAGYVSNSKDCNDSDPAISPAAVEVCGNKVDDNCNGIVDESTCYQCLNGTNLTTSNITSNSAQLNWKAVANPVQWQLQYKTTNQGSKWVDVLLTGNIRTVKLTGLNANQNYQWQIRAKCGNSWTAYTTAVQFKTAGTTPALAARTSVADIPTENQLAIKLYPNPTNGRFNVSFELGERKNSSVSVIIRDILGKVVYTEKNNIRNGLFNKQLQLPSSATSGVYIVEVITDGKILTSRLNYMK